jgi:hypothetical protein
MKRHARTLPLFIAMVAMLAFAAPGYGALAKPTVTAPTNGGSYNTLPHFSWNPVAGADHYEFQIAADKNFLSQVLGFGQDDFITKNTTATVAKTLPNGTYYWRVRAQSLTGSSQSAWSADAQSPQSFTMAWSSTPSPTSPTNGASLIYPQPLLLNWSDVAGAQKYRLTVATDPALGSALNGYPVDTSATSFSPSARLANGTYYWGVQPIDAEGRAGAQSPIWHFTWNWPTDTSLTVTDLDPSSQVYDPQFSWDPVAGAAKYEIEINSDEGFASGGKVCCSSTTISTSFTPSTLLPADTYYWRVRAIDSSGHAGDWNVYGGGTPDTFTIAFDTGSGAITNLHMRDNVSDPGAWSPGYTTQVPIITWDPVPGAAQYQVNVTPFTAGICDWGASASVQWKSETASTSWTPLGSGYSGAKPFNTSANVASDSPSLAVNGNYCVRVRAERNTDTGNHTVYGNYSCLGNCNDQASFQFIGYPIGGACTAPCNANYPGAGDYLSPITGTSTVRNPLFTWNPLSGKHSYYVVVATDPDFQNVVDYAFTQVPAYAPRQSFQVTTYADSNTSYYWAVLPATAADGTAAAGDPTDFLNHPQNFQKHSVASTLDAPDDGQVVTTQPTFQWSPVEGALRYRLEVSQDPSFGTLVGNAAVITDETAYTSGTTYPADTTLYWRVRAEDARQIGLAWSATHTFQKTNAAPTFLTVSNSTSGSRIPAWQWDAMPGAVGYDVHVDLPDGSPRDFSNMDTTAFTATSMTGTGIFTWKVRALYPTSSFGTITSPWSAPQTFARTIPAPSNPVTSYSAHKLLLSWDALPGAKQYTVELSTTNSFSSNIETLTTDNTSVAPRLESSAYDNGGVIYWHVFATDADNNAGGKTPAQTLTLPTKLVLTSAGFPTKGTAVTITIYTKDAYGHAVNGVKVTASGAGVTKTSKLSSRGKVTFKLKATKSGKLTFNAAKTGCVGSKLIMTVF